MTWLFAEVKWTADGMRISSDMRLMGTMETDAPVSTTNWHVAAPNLSGIDRIGGSAAVSSTRLRSFPKVHEMTDMMWVPYCSYLC